MIKELYEIKTDELFWDGYVMPCVRVAHSKRELVEKINETLKHCKTYERYGHRIYKMEIWYHAEDKLFRLFSVKQIHEKVFSWNGYPKNTFIPRRETLE